MGNWFQIVGEHRTVQIFDIPLVGVNADNGKKLLFTLVLVAFIWVLRRVLKFLTGLHLWGKKGKHEKVRFWLRQAIQIFTAILLIVGLASIWFDDQGRLATALGLFSAGLAFALQKVVTAIAGYFVILRSDAFNIGDRIVMGGVRGDVVGLGFVHTTIMEMGQPPGELSDAPSMWVKSRQYTGRIVAVSNSTFFDEPVYNYSREFPYIWEEMSIPIPFDADREKAEHTLLESAKRHSCQIAELSEEALAEMERRYFMRRADVAPKVFWRLTDNWLEMTVRFVTQDHAIREVKDKMSRDILAGLDGVGIQIASSTMGIVSLPPLKLQRQPRAVAPVKELAGDGNQLPKTPR